MKQVRESVPEQMISSFEVRQRRERGRAEKLKDDAKIALLDKIDANFNGDELYEFMKMVAPSCGFSSKLSSQVGIVNMCQQMNESFTQRRLRSILFEQFNIASLSRKSKNIMISMILKGQIAETEGYFRVGIFLEKLHHDRKMETSSENDYKIDYGKVNFKKLVKTANDIEEEGGDFFEEMEKASMVDSVTKEYFDRCEKFAAVRVFNLKALNNIFVRDKLKSNSTPVSQNGFLSNYGFSPKQNMGKRMEQGEVIAQAVLDFGLYIGADLEHLIYVSRSERERQLKKQKNAKD